MLRAALALVATLAACAPQDSAPVTRAGSGPVEMLPPMRMFSGGTARPPLRGNAAMARDFLELTFQLESGRALPVLTRFEAPVTVRVDGPAPPTLGLDLDLLLGRLRHEAGIDITRVAGGQASITITAVPRARLQRLVPQAACFVAPRISTWAEFRAGRRSVSSDWTTLKVRQRMAIFIPADVAPQEIRDCLHEELAQSLGPLNDLYRLPDSVFDDDNFQSVLTGFDMLMLRVTYAPELASGMTKAQVAARLPAILARLNPRGSGGGIAPPVDTPRSWIDAIEQALGPRALPEQRRAAAREALAIATRNGWTDPRRAFSLYVLGRLSVASDPDLALTSFLQADAIYAALPDTRLQSANVATQLAAYALSSGDSAAVFRIVDAAIPAAQAGESAGLLSQLMLMKAAALAQMGRADEARVVRAEALGWARYGFGADAEVRDRAAEIAALAPLGTRVAVK